MNIGFYVALLIVGMAFAIVFAAIPLFDRRYMYAGWAQVASVIAGIAVLGWGALGFILYHSHVAVSPHLFDALRYTKGFSAGVILEVLLARPWQKTQKAKAGLAR